MIIEQISDLHFGSNDDEHMYNEMKNGFIKHCNEVKPDIIAICGDCYDKRVLVNSNANIYLNKLMKDIVDTGATIILIEGTDSHDRHQIDSFAHYCNDKFFIFNTVNKLYTNGLNILILPEEYVKSVDYYKDYINENEKYDFVFGHGMFSHTSFGNNNILGEYNRKPFVFDYSMFKDIVKYNVGFGHIHTHNVYKNIIYGGSYSRLNFGEEEPKGWIEYDLDLKNSTCEYKFIENTEAKTFKTINASELPDDLDNLLTQLRNYSEFNDYLRITVDSKIDISKLNTIQGFVKNNSNTVIQHQYKLVEDTIINDKITTNIVEKQQILKDRMKEYYGLSFIEITQKIAKSDYNEDISEEFINNILNTDKH